MASKAIQIMDEHSRVPVKAWVDGVLFEDEARQQLLNTSQLPIVHHHVAAMPDCHWGMGATVGSVIPTVKAIIPAAVGVDIGCGMMAAMTSLTAADLPDSLKGCRLMIEQAVPHGRGRRGGRDPGGWGQPPEHVARYWQQHLAGGFKSLCERYPALEKAKYLEHLGTLGTGNHFIELCLDEQDRVWVMLHSGSRGVGNLIANLFIEQARLDMERVQANLPDIKLAYLSEGSEYFDDYIEAVAWAQAYASANRELMMQATLHGLKKVRGLPDFTAHLEAISCHHNYVSHEHHFGADCYVTRKGAVSAREGELGIIPGSMGAKSYIVRGKGNPESFCSCSHGAGRAVSRQDARKRFSVEDHIKATKGVECRKDKRVIDETPMAYKDIDAVMAAQSDLVEVVHTLKQVVCVKG
ncbi:RtcB family protein [Marinobacterium sediminicola]|uniref:3'-phosphate/5'-hydroxy nucleic acid ligase n=1 Tax=Marinobacterium sediminicola TaxID=518898 RepID=A0ABY1S2L2_9GAMM|nr:RtcB family protein [Marinobacterium sediminicola]ULG68544.1 RtcB family protein [Marinobacterium sediminicola]SMR76598.1 tRNA-splicing ligase RtcB [Marinobacterium sediminicola]